MSFDWMSSQRSGAATRPLTGRSAARGQRDRRRFLLEMLEARTLLSGVESYPTYVRFDPNGSSPSQFSGPVGYTPAQIRKAYGIDSIKLGSVVGNGAGQTVAIVDAYDWPTASADLQAFDTQFGLPAPPSFKKVDQNGGTNLPAPSTNGWSVEEALDVEWVHSMAPDASIILVEANSAYDSDLIQTAVNTARSLTGVTVVSMSFGGGEFEGEQGLDSIFTTPVGHPGVTFLASTGDSSAPGGYPAFSPNVVAVGGTSLYLNADNSYQSESGWSGSGGGVSQVEPQPVYQSALPYSGRSTPDVSFDADPNTGVAVYDSYDFGASTPWDQIGGTSLACPSWAGLIAITNQERAAFGHTSLDGPSQTLPLLYSISQNDFHDITSGDNGYPAGPGYDLVTGIGTPIAPQLVRDLAQLPVIVTPTPPTNAMEGTALTNIQIATFTDAPLASTGSYSATIDWGDGTAVDTHTTIVDLGNGSYGIDASHTYAEEGDYSVNIQVTGPTTHVGGASFSLTVNDAPLTPIPATLTSYVGSSLSGTFGSFVDGNPAAPISDFSVSIDWGDGGFSDGAAVATATPGLFDIQGTHPYLAVGTFTVAITINDVGGSTTTIDSTVNVLDALLTGAKAPVDVYEGVKFTQSVGSFISGNQFAQVTDYSSAVVQWGDGSANSTLGHGVAILATASGFDVMGTHTYPVMGTYPITVDVTSSGGSSVHIVSQADVLDALYSVTVNSQSLVEGGSIGTATSPIVIGTITDGNPYGTAAELVPGSTVAWGDGTISTILKQSDSTNPTQPYLVALGNGVFDVMGTHTYGDELQGKITINAVDTVHGGTDSGSGTIIVADAPLLAQVATATSVAGQAAASTAANPIATFTDQYLSAPISDYTVSIVWGDRTVSAGYVVQPGGPGTVFDVLGGTAANPGHLYAQAGTYAVQVTINDVGGSTASAASKAVIADAPITDVYVSTLPTVIEGGSYGGEVAMFTNGNTMSTASDFIATINWGDGGQSLGQVTPILSPATSQSTGTYTVSSTGTHFFGTVGQYPVSVQIISLGGNHTTANTFADGTTQATINVKEPGFTDVTTPAMAVTGVAGNRFTGVVGAFTEYAQTPVTDFVATINWGDAPAGAPPDTTTGVVSLAPTHAKDGSFLVSGAHTYENFGAYKITVMVSDVSNPDVVNTSQHPLSNTASIADVPLTGLADAISGVANENFDGAVATFTSPNMLAQLGEYKVTIDWGDGTVPMPGVVTGGDGSFTVSGAHLYTSAAKSLTTVVTITHTNPDSGFSSNTPPLMLDGTAHVLAPLSGAMSRSSDSGASNTDGITNVTQPVFVGKGEPGAIVQVFAGAGGTSVGTTTIDSSGNWTVTSSALADGRYTFVAEMIPPAGGTAVQTETLPITPSGGTTLVVDTAGPTVSSVTFNPKLGQVQFVLQDNLAGLYPAGLNVGANFQLAAPNASGTALSPFAVSKLVVSPGAAGQSVVTVNYNMGSKARTGTFVVTIQALGITDWAGNTMVEKKLIAFPQTTNSPNPNYIVEIDVAKNSTTSAPKQYISLAEQRAAAAYSAYAQSRKVVRVPSRPTITAATRRR